MRCERVKWRGRDACSIGNELVELTHLTGGGHVADFHFRPGKGPPAVNPLWVPRWKTIEPFNFDPRRHAKIYGNPPVGKTLACIAGHSLCLDLFGTPSVEEGRLGIALHGEAGVKKWKVSLAKLDEQAEMQFSVRLPMAELRFKRTLTMREGESVIYIRETVENERKADQFFQWQQHATLGAPFLDTQNSIMFLPGARGLTYPLGYEGQDLLKSGKVFHWPFAPRFDSGRVDLRRPLTTRRRGFVAGVQLMPKSTIAFVCALNTKLSLLIGYCFRREDFPWVALWEENRVRRYSPWRGREQARGIEFGASPLPLSRVENASQGRLFGTPTLAHVPARGARTVGYVLFLAWLPRGFNYIADVIPVSRTIRLVSDSDNASQILRAELIRKFVTA